MLYYNTCPICGRQFYVTSADWVYKIKWYDKKSNYERIDYYCRYSCWRAAEKQDISRHYNPVTLHYSRKRGE